MKITKTQSEVMFKIELSESNLRNIAYMLERYFIMCNGQYSSKNPILEEIKDALK